MMRKRYAATSLIAMDATDHAIFEFPPKDACSGIRKPPDEGNLTHIGFGNTIVNNLVRLFVGAARCACWNHEMIRNQPIVSRIVILIGFSSWVVLEALFRSL
jgi:hypothetical protein